MKVLRESIIIMKKLLKLMVPISILVKILTELGLIDIVANVLGPIMRIMGLSGEMGLVWATAMVTNIYGGILVLLTMAENSTFTVAEVTIVSTLMLFAHSLPLESKIISETGAKISKILGIRVFCGIISGALMNIVFKTFNLYSETAVFKVSLKASSPGVIPWILGEIKKYASIFIIIFILLLVMEGLKKIGILDMMNRRLAPLMTMMGIDSKLSFVCIVGLTMGIGYGGGLIIKEIRANDYSKRDLFLVAVFMSLCHALIEDTLLMLPLGAKFSGVFIMRIVMATIFTLVLNKILPRDHGKEVINYKETT